MIRASRESSAYGGFRLTEALISSLSSGEMLTALVSVGRLGKLSGRTNTLRIFSAPTQRNECTCPLGIQKPRWGGTVHWFCAECTTITPSVA
jgi:hypothetical protein